MHKLLWMAGSVFLLASFVVAQGQDADEAEIRRLEHDWSAAAQNRDVEKCVAVFADDAMVLGDRVPIAKGKAQIREIWTKMLASPDLKISFGPTTVEVAKSRDIAYEVGTYDETVNDENGNPIREVGKYVVVWKRQTNKQWKAVIDIFNPDK